MTVTDEKYSFVSDVRDKKVTARSARSKRTHAGKGGRVRLPSDNLSKKELQKMNGECKSYKLNDPMAWKEFKVMPDDIKITYIKLLRQKFNPPVTYIAKMMGVSEAVVRNDLKRLNMTEGKGSRSGRTKWDKEGFYAWWHGVDMLPTPVPEEHDAEPIPEEKEAFVEEDIPWNEPNPYYVLAIEAEIVALKTRIDELLKCNEELMSQHESDRHVIDKLRLVCSEYEEKMKILEAQMEVVRLIFGGKNHE